jgi:hypothetical protein
VGVNAGLLVEVKIILKRRQFARLVVERERRRRWRYAREDRTTKWGFSIGVVYVCDREDRLV